MGNTERIFSANLAIRKGEVRRKDDKEDKEIYNEKDLEDRTLRRVLQLETFPLV